MLYKIKDKNGKFSTGGMDVRLTKKGKIWSSKQALISHLRLLENTIARRQRYMQANGITPEQLGNGAPFGRASWVYTDCIVIEIDETGVELMKEIPFGEWITNYINEKSNATAKSPE